MDINKTKNTLRQSFTNWQYAINEKKPNQGTLRERYKSARTFCLDCDILTFTELERLEYECLTRIDKCNKASV